MPSIKVNAPFGLRLSSDAPVREFGKGTHGINKTELGHWFMQGVLAEGRAVLLTEEEQKAETPTKEQLMKLTRVQLAELATACDIEITDAMQKEAICDLLQTGQTAFRLIKTPDGIGVEKV